MTKKILSLSLAMAAVASTWAADVTQQQALTIAKQFFCQQLSGENGARSASQIPTTISEHQGYYIINRGQGQGFVIVADDDRAYQVLGYSLSGSLHPDDAPQQLRQWLKGYTEEMDYLKKLPVSSKAVHFFKSEYQPVAPLLGETAWNQLYPYNLLTPCFVGTTHSATGCAATAMAQILYFHQYPDHGLGQTSYHTGQYRMNLSIDFTESTYDWELMKPVYGDWDSEESRQAVAVLMRDCGYAIGMDYGAVSGAEPDAWPSALINHFGYDRGLQNRYRAHYSLDEWNRIIRHEIDARRPVFAGGFASSGGHAFVFDGYDEEGLIHVNWGWGGVSNGYFRTSALTPAIQGTGGADGGFNARQSIITGIQPPQQGSELTPEFLSSEKIKATPSLAEPGEPIDLRLNGKVANSGWCDITADFGFGIYDAAHQLVLALPAAEQEQTLAVGAFRVGISLSGADLSQLPEGQYTVWPIAVEHGGNRWTKVRDNNSSKPNYLKMSVLSNGDIQFSDPTKFVLSARNVNIDTRCYQGVKTSVSATLQNTGDMEYSSDIRVTLYNAIDGTRVAQSDNYLEEVYAQDTLRVSIVSAYDVAPGDYMLSLTDENQQPLCELVPLTVLPRPEGDAAIEAVEGLFAPEGEELTPEHLSFTAHLHAPEGVFAAYVGVYIYDEYETTTTPLGSLSSQFVFVEPDGTVEIRFSGTMENGMPGTTYKATLINLDENTYIKPRVKASCTFTLGGTLAGIEAATGRAATGRDQIATHRNGYALDGRPLAGSCGPRFYPGSSGAGSCGPRFYRGSSGSHSSALYIIGGRKVIMK